MRTTTATTIRNSLLSVFLLLVTLFIFSCDKSEDDNPSESSDIPECIQEMLDLEDHNYVRLSSYEWNGETYYYFLAGCCDFFNDLYNTNCNYICSPDGGIHGGGDGQCPNFNQESCCEKLLWEI